MIIKEKTYYQSIDPKRIMIPMTNILLVIMFFSIVLSYLFIQEFSLFMMITVILFILVIICIVNLSLYVWLKKIKIKYYIKLDKENISIIDESMSTIKNENIIYYSDIKKIMNYFEYMKKNNYTLLCKPIIYNFYIPYILISIIYSINKSENPLDLHYYFVNPNKSVILFLKKKCDFSIGKYSNKVSSNKIIISVDEKENFIEKLKDKI